MIKLYLLGPPTCRASGGDACQRAIELFRHAAPQIGTLIAGGNATLGQGSTLGRLGHFVLTMRVNGTSKLGVPQVDDQPLTAGPVQRSSYTVLDVVYDLSGSEGDGDLSASSGRDTLSLRNLGLQADS